MSHTAKIVFVPGAWHGAWCFRDVERGLRALGYTVFSLTLTGLGDRAHLMSPTIGLETHVADVIAVLDTEELRDVVLVGHSYAGAVITMVAERRPDVIAMLVYLDAIVPEAGETVMDHFPAGAREALLAATIDNGAGLLAPVPSMEFLGVDPAHAAWVTRRLTPHPLRTGTDCIDLRGGLATNERRVYVDCDTPPNPAMLKSKVRIGGPNWVRLTLHTGHDPFVSDPAALVTLLDGAVSAPAPAERTG